MFSDGSVSPEPNLKSLMAKSPSVGAGYVAARAAGAADSRNTRHSRRTRMGHLVGAEYVVSGFSRTVRRSAPDRPKVRAGPSEGPPKGGHYVQLRQNRYTAVTCSARAGCWLRICK